MFIDGLNHPGKSLPSPCKWERTPWWLVWKPKWRRRACRITEYLYRWARPPVDFVFVEKFWEYGNDEQMVAKCLVGQ